MAPKYNLSVLLFSRVVSEVGNMMFTFALSLFVLDTTESAFSYSLILGFSLLARTLGNIASGNLADRLNKKNLIVSAEILNALVLGILIVFLWREELNWTFTFFGSVLLNIFSSLLRVSTNAAIPELLKESQANKANGMFHSIGAISMIVGPLLAALFYEHVGLVFILFWSAISYGISAILLLFLSNPDTEISDTLKTTKKITKEQVTNFKDAITYIRSYVLLYFFLRTAAMLNFILYPMMVLVMPYIVYQVIGLTATGLSIIQAAWALGMTIGAAFIMRRNDTSHFMQKFFSYLLFQGILIAGWAFASLSVLQDFNDWFIVSVYSVLVFFLGGLQMFVQIPLYSYFQFRIEKSYRGKVWGIANAMTDIAAPFGLWIYGIVLEGVEWYIVPLVTGILVVLMCTYFVTSKGSKGQIAKELSKPLQQGG
ncbi:MFS transporter [Paenibacillus silvae]|uniref:MFS transporter n=1 Tax=Paenibacillus TaxID=44249 RepID=UPI001C123723|nr:MFS transporter [Paenibacillus barcinonensis]MBU5352597.1 MFS transporter [Paenibacillus barcinonensis]